MSAPAPAPAPATFVDVGAGRLRLTEVMSAAWVAHAVSVLAELGVADHLDDPRTADELARRTGCDPSALLRFLRAGCAAAVLTELEVGQFALTEAGRLLRDDAPGSMRDMCRVTGREEFARTWAHAAHTARTGTSSFTSVYGETVWDHMARPENRDFSALFQSAMRASASTAVLLDQYDFSGVGHLVDVGGGRGAMVAAALNRYQHLRATVFDLATAVEGAPELLTRAGVADRAEVVAGSFFGQIPAGGDVYLLSRIIANWNDGDSVRLLRGVRAAMHPNARLVIVGHMPGPADRTHYVRALDLYMFVLLEAKLRSREEYEELFAAAQLELTRFSYNPDEQSLIEARPA